MGAALAADLSVSRTMKNEPASQDRRLSIAFVTLSISVFVAVATSLWLDLGHGVQLLVALAVLALIGAGVAVLLAKKAPLAGPAASNTASVHPGITLHAIPVAGAMGAVFGVGYLVMFWFGVPEWRPVVLLSVAAGVLFGGCLILAGRRHRTRPDRPMDLR